MKQLMILLVCGLSVMIAGCVKTVDGRNKAALNPFSKDKIEGRYERTVAQVFDASKGVLSRLGKINSEDTINKTLTSKVDTRSVWVKVTEVDPKISKVTVQARTKGGSADITLAAQIEKEIALTLATGK